MNESQNDTENRPSAVPWPPILIAATLVAALALGYVLPLPWPGMDDLAARAVGVTLGAIGLALLFWSAITLARHNTTVMPHKGSTALVTTGPFAWLRNPIYLGDVLIFLGAAEITKNVWFVILIPVFAGLVTWLAILPEERHLESRFGDAYRDYKARTRRWI